MNRSGLAGMIAALALAVTGACGRHAAAPAELQPKAYGAAIVLVSGEKQVAGVGAALDQPVVVQVNDAKGAPVPGALVRLAAAGSVRFLPDRGLTGSDGQFTAGVSLGSSAGRYQIVASTAGGSGKRAEVRVEEIALGYRETLGQQINAIHCIRCHDSESTPERVSNHDNLKAQPHSFTEGAIMNSMSDAALVAMIGHGGAALNKSAEMPPYGNTLTPAEIDALVAFIRAVADPPYRPQGVFDASN
ncbi:MAG: c-type cytochrome [Acidobacteriia bacterium]|nr:c-type cytochrome [Terriglobia bacterium]